MPYLSDPTLQQPRRMKPCDVKTATLRVKRNGVMLSIFCLAIDDEHMVGFDVDEAQNLVDLMSTWLDENEE